MLKAATSEIPSISLEGIKPTWKISDPQDVVECNGAEFVRVNPVNSSLRTLVLASTEWSPSDISMSANKGLRYIINLRNEAQIEAASESSRASSCQLFDKIAKKQKVLHDRGEQQSMRNAPESITLQLELDGEVCEVEVLKSVHPLDKLFIKYDKKMLAAVLHCLRTKGFDDKRSKSSTLPKDVHVRKKGGFLTCQRTSM